MRKKHTMLRRAFGPIRSGLCLAGVLLFFWVAVNNANSARVREGRNQLELALRRAAVSCYAVRGAYPPTLDVLVEYSGIQIDRTRYQVFYEIFADNLMPEVTVVVMEP